MPLQVITANRGKDLSIFDYLNPFVEKLVGAYKQKQQNLWDNEWMSAALSDIENASNNQSIDLMSKINPPVGYVDTEGVSKFAQDAVTLLQQEKFTGIPQVQSQFTPQEDTGIKEGDLIPNVKEFNELYKFVSELPTGQVDWTNTLDVFKKKLESGRAMGSAAQQFMNMIMGQSMPTDQRAKFEQDFKFTKNIQDTLYPEMVEDKPSSDYERWLADKESFEEFKAIGKEPETKLDIDALNKFMEDNDLKVKGVTVNDKGEKNISLEPIEGGEPKLSDMLILIKELEAQGFNASYSKGGLSVGVPEPKAPAGEETFTTTEMNYVDKEFEDVKTNEQYDTALLKVRSVDKNIPVPLKEKIFKSNYDETISFIKSCIDNNGKIKEGNPGNSNYSYEQIYTQAYSDLQEAINEYQKATGQSLQNPFLSFEEYQKSDIKPGMGLFYPSTWGKQKSVGNIGQ